ncbi:MAG: SDR family oxidoreductase [Proteobacteria bacterium]|nr:SDR family oxidoreductase [Pseudomonadota bacterium]
MELNNAWVVITGASRGIGATIAKAFAQKGATLILIARSKEGLEKTCHQVENLGGKAHAIPFDLEKISQIENLVEKIYKLTPRVDVLINNAGLEKYCFYTNYQCKDILSILSVNLIAPMELTRLLLPGMLNQRKGHIINISSVAGKLAEIYNTLYDTSKGGMELWTDALRQELYKTNVKVSSINPGGVTDAGMIYNIGEKYPILLGSCTSQDVADAVINCTSRYKSRVFVNNIPIKPLVIINVLFPRLLDAISRWIGLTKVNRKKVEKRLREDILKSTKENSLN